MAADDEAVMAVQPLSFTTEFMEKPTLLYVGSDQYNGMVNLFERWNCPPARDRMSPKDRALCLALLKLALAEMEGE